jgi:hypothetical protein
VGSEAWGEPLIVLRTYSLHSTSHPKARRRYASVAFFVANDTPAGKVWILTEADRSVTTILLPEED